MDGFNQGYFLIPSPLKYLENVSRDLPSDSFLSEWYFIIESKTSFYPVRKPPHSCLSADRYAGDGGNTCKGRSISSFWWAGSKPCPF